MRASGSGTIRSRRLSARSVLAAALLAGAVTFSHAVAAQGWVPQRHVEFIAPVGAGGAMDTFTRTLERIAREYKFIPVTSNVVNRAGGEHAVAYNYLHQRAGDPHFLSTTSPVLLANHITGANPLTYTDMTPISSIMSEYYLFVVRGDSPIKTAKDLIEGLAQRPDAFSMAGGNQPQRMAIGAVIMAAKADPKRAKIVTISGAKTSLTVAGGHVDVGVAAPGQALTLIEGGHLRPVAVSGSKRLGGPLAQVPTWTELGYKDATIETFRAVIAPKDLTPAQVAFWEGVMQRIVETEDFRKMAEKLQWVVTYRNAAETRKFMEEEYAQMKRLMTFMGIIK